MVTSEKSLLVIVTGLSGAGRSVAINALEDSGFYCIDNMPLAMVDAAVDFIQTSPYENYAVGMDIRDANFVREFLALNTKLRDVLKVDVLFLTASEEALSNRYSTTRRRHPLLDTGGELVTAIRREREMLRSVEEVADAAFDTTLWSPHQLARIIEERYSADDPARNLYVTVTSFGFKYGQYRPADSIYDVRFLDNPHFVSSLREKTGLNKAVKDYVFQDDRTSAFLDKIVDLHEFLLPQYFSEGKHYFRIGIGCTGGKHRSVCLAEELGLILTEKQIPNVLVSVSHRDLGEFNPPVQR